jgi:transmembrane sensor
MSGFDALFRQIAKEQDALRESAGVEARLLGRMRAAPPVRRPRRSWVLLAAALGIAGAVLAVVFAQSPSALALKISGADGAQLLGAWLGAPDAKPLSLEFSDGSRFDLTPKSRARVVSVEPEGARVELAAGSMKVHVVHRPNGRFRLDAGPFGVRVTGTRFDLSYSEESDTFELFLEEGQVELTGCVFGQGRKLAAGQNVRATCRRPSVDISYGRRAPSARAAAPSPVRAAPPAPAPASSEPVVAAPPAERVRAASVPAGKGTDSAWLVLAREGAHQEAFALVRAAGFEAECARASSETLALLADVARHAGAPAQAEHALFTMRRRFPGTDAAALAAFALGRKEFDEKGSFRTAATWFKTYLRERPTGAMKREALGRLLEASHRAGDAVDARSAALRYLSDYPTGPHAELASRVVSSP